MEIVTVNILRDNVISDIRVKSHAEVATIADPTERYLIEAGTEKLEELHQCITNAATELLPSLRKFLVGYTVTNVASDDYSTANIQFILETTARKSPGLAESLTNAIHAYIVDSAMAKFYTSVSRIDFAERHLTRLTAEMSVIDNLVCHRRKPSY